mmetsp:Transcript_39884/g.62212  ORF Transcript_39884/g.62212 Transcript_39884/m.62212 type:complete len:177 (-) Transcript_39884:658-1188(-)
MIVESYGDNANNMYLRFFGFVPESNPTDCRKMRFDISQVKENKEKKQEVLQQIRMRPFVETCLRKGEELPKHVMVFLRVLHLKDDEYNKIDTLRGGHQVSIRNEKALMKTVVAMCEKQLERFKTSIEDDDEKLNATYTGPSLSTNQRHAIMARVSEKRILKRLRKMMKAKLKSLKS